MKKICKVILAAVAVAALAAPAMAAEKLKVMDITGANKVFVVEDTGNLQVNNSSGVGQVILTNTGRIGLGGNTAPTVAMHAKGPDVYTTQAIMHRNDAAPNPSGGGGFIAYHNNNNALPNSGDRLGYFLFGSVSPTDGFARNGGGIAARAEAAWADTAVPTYFTFETAAVGTTARTERLRITANGNIVAGNNAGAAAGTLALTATDGFLYIPTTAGAVTSCATVTAYTGHAPIWYDTTNNKLCTCVAGVRKCAPTAFN